MTALHKIINAYTRRFRFPFRGLKFFLRFLRATGLDRKKFQKKIHNGLLINVCPQDHIQRQLFWYGYYEKEAFLLAEKLLPDNAIVLDIGANIGYFSLLAAAKAPHGRIIAFEPLPFLQKEIKENSSLNGIKNISVEPFALGNESGQGIFYVAAESNIGMSGLKPQENFTGITLPVSITSLDDWLLQHPLPRIDMVKIDTEGAELNVLMGMKDTLEKYRPVILLEAMDHLLSLFGAKVGEVYSLLAGFQYQAYRVPATDTLQPASDSQQEYSLLFLPADYPLPAGIRINRLQS